MSEHTHQNPTETSLKQRLQECRLEEMATHDKILKDLRTLNLGIRATKLFCERELGYTEIEARGILISLGLILTSEAMLSDDPVVRMKIEKLRNWRRERARAEGQAAFRILSNRVLMAVASQPTNSTEELKGIKGFGELKMKRFGGEIVNLLNS